jgi:hypothetical protein
MQCRCLSYYNIYIYNVRNIRNITDICNILNDHHQGNLSDTQRINRGLYFFPVAQQPLLGQGLLIIEVSRSHTSDTPHTVGLLWTSDQPVAETST